MSVEKNERPRLDFNDAKPQSYFDRVPLETEEHSIDEVDEALRAVIVPLLQHLFPDEEMRVHGDFVSVGVDGLFVLTRGFCGGDFFPEDFGYIGSPVDLIGVATGKARAASAVFAKDFLEIQCGRQIERLSIAQCYSREVNRLNYYEDVRSRRAALPSVGDLSLFQRKSQKDNGDGALLEALRPDELGPDIFSIENPNFDELLYKMASEAPANHIPTEAHEMRARKKKNGEQKIRWMAAQFWTKPKVAMSEYNPCEHKRMLLRSTVGSGKTSVFLEALIEQAPRIRDRMGRCVHIDIVAPTHDLLDEIAGKFSDLSSSDGLGQLKFQVIHFHGRDAETESGTPFCKRNSEILDPVYEARDSMSINFCERERHQEKSPTSIEIGFGKSAEEGSYCKLSTKKGRYVSDSPRDIRIIDRCAHHHICPYIKQYERAKLPDYDFVIRLITHKGAAYTPPFGMLAADYVVVDEDPTSAFVSDDRKMSFSFSLFEQAHMGQRHDEFYRPLTDDAVDIQAYNALLARVETAFRSALARVRASVAEHCLVSGWSKNDWNERLQEILSENGILKALCDEGIFRKDLIFLHSMDEDNIIPHFGDPRKHEGEIVAAQPQHNLTSRDLGRVWRALLTEEGVAQKHSRQLTYRVKIDQAFKATVQSKFVLTIWNRENNPTLLDEVTGELAEGGRFSRAREKLVQLDATANSDALNEIFGPLESVVAEFPHNAKIYIDQSQSFSKTALTNKKTGRALRDVAWETIDKISGTLGEKGFVVLPKEAKIELLRDRGRVWEIGPTGAEIVSAEEQFGKIPFLHFGAERGLDRYRNADWGVVVGGQRLNAHALFRQVRSLFARSEVDVGVRKLRVSPKSTSRISPAVGRGLVERKENSGMKLTGFEDDRLQRAYVAAYEASIIQGAGRLRTVHGLKRRPIFILAAGVPDEFVGDWIKENENVRENEMKKLTAQNKFWETLASSGGAFVFQKDWMHALAPECFSTVGTAKNWLKNHGDEFRGGPPINRDSIEGGPLKVDLEVNNKFFVGRASLIRIGRQNSGRPPSGDIVVLAEDKQAAVVSVEAAAIAGGFRVVSLQLEPEKETGNALH